MADTYKLQYNGMTLTYPGWNGCVSYEAAPAFKTLTLYHSEGGTLTANELTGYPGDTINLSTAYNTYWRFSGYQWTGDGELSNNTYTFGNEDASICACYKPNAFTASGGFEGGDETLTPKPTLRAWKTFYFTPKYITASYKTSNVPTAWYATSNRWKVTSNVSAYSLTMAVKASFSGKITYPENTQVKLTAYSFVGNSLSNSQTMNLISTTTASMTYNKSVTTTTTGVNYGLSAAVAVYRASNNCNATAINRAAGRTGTWVATGIIP